MGQSAESDEPRMYVERADSAWLGTAQTWLEQPQSHNVDRIWMESS